MSNLEQIAGSGKVAISLLRYIQMCLTWLYYTCCIIVINLSIKYYWPVLVKVIELTKYTNHSSFSMWFLVMFTIAFSAFFALVSCLIETLICLKSVFAHFGSIFSNYTNYIISIIIMLHAWTVKRLTLTSQRQFKTQIY